MRGSRILWTILLCFAPCLLSTCLRAQYGGGTGEPNDPYLIYTPVQMNAIGADPNHWDKYFKLRADIDLSEYTGERFNVIGRAYEHTDPRFPGHHTHVVPFTGVFDGNDHAIVNFTWNSLCQNYVGIFGYVDGPAAAIKNLHIIDANVAAGEGADVGSLVGCFASGTLTRCNVYGASISGFSRVGGLAGTASLLGPPPWDGNDIGASIITDCSVDGRMAGAWWVGGLVGQNAGRVVRCVVTGNIVGQAIPPAALICAAQTGSKASDSSGAPSSSSIGGLAGVNWGAITGSYTDANVAGDRAVGNLVGSHGSGTIADCYATGSVNGAANVGGLIGDDGGVVKNCYSSSVVTGVTSVGGLVGTTNGRITYCHASGPVAGTSNVGGLAGTNGLTLTDCYATGDVAGDDDRASNLGGLVGSNGGNITGSYATGAVRGAEMLGGLVGSHNHGEITNCYSKGMVWGTRLLGGFAGSSYGTITNCYATGLVVGNQSMGGFAAVSTTSDKTGVIGSFWDVQTTRQATSAGGTGKSTFKMQSAHTFLAAGWDFADETANGAEDIWWIDEGSDYPRLAWELETASAEDNTDAAAMVSTGESP